MVEINKELMIDSIGKFRTQSLFLELGYGDEAIYTFKDKDHELNGKKYLSLKRLYLETEDPTEYEFAITYLVNWKHWQRLCENKLIRRYIDEWRDELEVKLRSRGVKSAMFAAEGGNYQAAKWLADRGWSTRGAGRPTKADIDREKKIQAGIADEYEADVIRLIK